MGKVVAFRSILVLITLATCVGSMQKASATDFYWDADGATTAATGGTGTWTTASTWRTGSATGTLVTWTSASTNDAYFQGTAGAVSIGATAVTAGTAFFQVTGYTLQTDAVTTTRVYTGNISLSASVNLNLMDSTATTNRALSIAGDVSGGANSSLTILGAQSASTTVARVNMSSSSKTISVPIIINLSAAGNGGIVSTGAGNQISGTITNNSSGLTIIGATSGNALTLTSTAVVSGSQGLRFAAGDSGGAGTVTINSQSNYTGPTQFNAASGGVIKLGITNALPIATNVTMAFTSSNGGILDLNSFNQEIGSLTSGAGGGSITNNAATGTSLLKISGSAITTAFTLNITNGATAKIALERAGTGTTIIAGTGNTYSGGTTVSGGTLTVNALSSIGAATGSLIVSAADTITSALNLNDNQTVASLAGTLAGSGSATITLNASGKALTVTQTTTTSYAGVIAGSGNFAFGGSGSLTLGGINTYTGTTAITGGTLSVASTGSINGSSGLTVNGSNAAFNYNGSSAYAGGPITLTQGTISGTGTINTAVSVGVNAKISPGNSTGIQQFTAGMTWSNGGTYTWEIKDWTGTTAGTSFDQLQISGGNLAISSLTSGAFPASTFKIGITGLTAGNAIGAVPNFNAATPRSWVIATTGGLDAAFNSNLFTLDTSNFSPSNTLVGGNFSLSQSANNLLLTYTPGAVAFVYWNGGNNGIWNSTNTNWNSATAGGGSAGTYDTANTLIFESTAGTVVVSGTVSPASGLQFNTSGYVINGGTINLVGANATANTLTTPTSVIATISSAITAFNGITKSGAGTLVLSGTNTIASTAISGGALNIQSAGALGTGNVGVADGAALELQGGIVSTAGGLALIGTGVSSGGALRNVLNNNTYSGTITLGAAVRINSDSGILTLNSAGAITGSGFNLTVGGAGDTTISSVVGIAAGVLTKDGNGTLILGNTNTYTGGTLINAGILSIGSDGNLGDVTGAVTFAGGTLRATAAITSTRTITVNTGGGTIANGGNAVTLSGSATINATLATTGAGNVTFAGSAMTFGPAGKFDIGTGGSLTIAGAYSTISMPFGGTFTGDLILNTTARLNFNGTGVTYGGAGKIYILGGSVGAGNGGSTPVAGAFASFNALFSNTSNVDGGTITSNIVMNPADGGPLSGHVAFTPGNITGANYVTASFLTFIGTTSDTRTLTVGDSTHANGIISGEGDLFLGGNSKTGGGAGQLVLNAANAYTGNTLINTADSSRIKLGVTNALPVATNVVFGSLSGAGNATLNLNGNNQQIASLSDDAAKPTGKNLTITNGGTADSILTISGSVSPANAFGGVVADGATNKISVVKDGSNTQTFSGINTYTGTTTVNAGTFILGSSTALPPASAVVLQGGTLGLKDGTTIATSGTLKLNGSAVIDFGSPTTPTSLSFGNSSGTPWIGTLTISNWNGLPDGTGTSHLVFGSDASGLQAAQLAQINFAGYGLGAAILSNGELVPSGAVPEPGTILGISAAGLGLAGWIRRRRR